MSEQFEGTQIEAIARSPGHTDDGLTGTEIGFLLGAAKINDVQPTEAKWRRLHNAFAMHQNAKRDRTHILAFIRKAMKPERWLSRAIAFCGPKTRKKSNAFISCSRPSATSIPAIQATIVNVAELTSHWISGE